MMHPSLKDKWNESVEKSSTKPWSEFLKSLDGFDLFPLTADFGTLRYLDEESHEEDITVTTWVNHMLSLDEKDINRLAHDDSIPVIDRLPLFTYLAWCEKVKTAVSRAFELGLHRGNGALTYYSDLLHFAVLVSFETVNSRVELIGGLAIPQPKAYLDPVQAVQKAKSRRQIDVLKRTLASPVRIVMQRNCIVGVDRIAHPGVFGPTIDTLLLGEWLFVNYCTDQTSRGAAWRARHTQPRILEIGCGNGLLTSLFARSFDDGLLESIDIDAYSVECTNRNIRVQDWDRGTNQKRYLGVGEFDVTRHPEKFDLIVCNPPYIPNPPDSPEIGHWNVVRSTHGTDLLIAVIRAAERMLSDSGQLVMVASRMAEKEIYQSLSETQLKVERRVQRLVPFDIDLMDEPHLKWLQQERGLRAEEGGYSHSICVYQIKRENLHEL